MSNVHGAKWIREEKRWAIYARDGIACVYCGSEDNLTLDHLATRDVGGSHHETNLVTCCGRCNSRRRDLPLRVWLQWLRDDGIDTTGMAKRIRRMVRRPIDRDLGRRLLAARRGR